ncbi:MAG: mechanosensitive ion channel [Flavobacteriaceae bacterium]|jgi:small conductance mechanosensitive channel|nr:mechanosensitive ion channel [Formosa sp.]MDG1374665.1 mechanosensitive ion channel [Flavobacteriaceae bacterium]MDG2498913.1 mechanosensitive ion channel [Flavobacteriaceae bacterium]
MEKYLIPVKNLLIEYSPKVLYAFLILIIGLYAIKLFVRIINKILNSRHVDKTLQTFLGNLLGWGLKALLLIAVISELGIDTTALAAVIAAAGLGLGLALQGSLANFAGGILIILFKPFKVDDLINAQGEIGVVKEIQLFTTQILTANNKRVIIPNGALANNNIVNLSAEGTLRVDLTIGVGYDEDIKKTKAVLMKVLTSHPKVLSDPIPTVNVLELADSSVNFAVRPWSTVEDYWTVYYDVIENCKEALDAEGIEIPYPHVVEVRKK